MLRLSVLMLLAGCAPTRYAYSFDITDPGARNAARRDQRDTVEDADTRAAILVLPGSAFLLDLTNKTEAPLDVSWGEIAIIGPDHRLRPIAPDARLPSVAPQGTVGARLGPFALPSRGRAAVAYDKSQFELVVPMVVRGAPREVRYHLRARVTRL
jgi:hypothetical protein